MKQKRFFNWPVFRQIGKTTLALEVAKSRSPLYLDLESPSDRNKLSDPELYLREHADKLVNPGLGTVAIKIKRSLAPKPSRGFHTGSQDIGADHCFVLYPGDERYSQSANRSR